MTSEEYKKGLAAGRKVIEEGTKPIIRDALNLHEEKRPREEAESPLKAVDPVVVDANSLFRKRKNESERVA